MALKRASGPDRTLDRQIAAIMGYERKVEYQKNPSGKVGKIVLWKATGTDNADRLPEFTNSIDDAISFLNFVVPSNICAITWDAMDGVAHLDGEQPVVAATPAIALCISALLVLAKRERTSSLQ